MHGTKLLFKKRTQRLQTLEEKRAKRLGTLEVDQKMKAYIDEHFFLPTCVIQSVIGETRLVENNTNIVQIVMKKGRKLNRELTLSPLTENGLQFVYVCFFFVFVFLHCREVFCS